MSTASPQRRRPPTARKGRIGGNPLVDSAEHTPPVSPLANAEWVAGNVVPPATFQPPAADAGLAGLPVPYEAVSDSPELSGRERADLAKCETALLTLRRAFADAGQALQVIRDGRLYRETHATFDEYCMDRWDMQRAHADRLIRAWPLAKAIDPIGSKIVEGQVRELLPLAERHGEDAAITVYKAVADNVPKVTAEKLKGALAVLPADHFDEREAVAQIRAYLAGELRPAAAPPADPGEQVERVRATIRRIRLDRLRVVAPEARRELAGELRALADELAAE